MNANARFLSSLDGVLIAAFTAEMGVSMLSSFLDFGLVASGVAETGVAAGVLGTVCCTVTSLGLGAGVAR